MTLRTITHVAPAAAGSANVAWGPDFGESSDNNTFTVGASAALTDLALEGNFTVGDNVTLTDLVAVYTGPTVGTQLTMPELALVNDKTVGAQVTLASTLQVNNRVASKDSWADIISLCPTDNNHNGTVLSVEGVAATRKDVVIGFDLSSYPIGYTVTAATLRLVLNAAPTTSSSDLLHLIITAAEGWLETTVKCSNFPTGDGLAIDASFPVLSTDTQGTVYNLTLNAAARTRIAARMGVGSFSLRVQGSSNTAFLIRYWDKDTGAAADRPQLTFTANA